MATALEKYLQYYKGLEKPGFAVLVTGEWGAGKTFQILNALALHEYYYVSLYGLKSADEVHAAIFAEVAPTKSKIKKWTSKVGDAVGAVGGSFKLAVPFSSLVNSFIKNADITRMIIFDDMERAEMKPQELLGAINKYVEQNNCRVCIVAHDKKLDQQFGDTKEKLIGHTIKAEPQFEAAFDSFVQEIKDRSQQVFVRDLSKDIIQIFHEGDVKSLRVLRHVVSDLGRLFACLDRDVLDKDEAVLELIRLFSIFNVEYRLGRLNDADLSTRLSDINSFYLNNAVRRHNGEAEEDRPSLIKAYERYPSVDLSSNILSDELLLSLLSKGIYDPEEVTECVKNSKHFLDVNEAPAWRTIIEFDELEDETVETAITKLRKDFDQNTVLNPGEILQSFSLLLMLSSVGGIESSVEEVKAECKSYIDHLLENDLLEKCNSKDSWYEIYGRSHAGYSYWIFEGGENDFYELQEYLFDQCVVSFARTLPNIQEELFADMKDEPEQFAEKISFTGSGEHVYARAPVFSAIKPIDFVHHWMNVPKAHWRIIAKAMENRFLGSRLDGELAPEKSWILEVRDKLNEESDKLGGYKGFRIKRIVQFNIEGCIPEDD